MDFRPKMGMDYGASEMYGFFINFLANQLGKTKNVWVMEKYGLSELWVIGVSTVAERALECELIRFKNSCSEMCELKLNSLHVAASATDAL